MNIFTRQTLLFAALVAPALTQTPNVIVLPAGPPADLVNRNATVLSADSFTPNGTPAVGIDAYAAFTLPNGTKSYVLAKGATNTVTVLSNATSGVTFVKNIDLGTGSTDAALTPDGKRLLVVSLNEAALTIIDTNSDSVVVKVPLSAPANTVVSNFESSRAFTASPNGALVTAVDLVTNVPIGTINIPSEITLVSGLAVAPNGLIYLSAVNRLFEIDPRIVDLTPAQAIVMTGSPGRPQFTPDGSHALMNNYTPISGGSALILADLTNRTTQFTSLSGLTIDRFRVVSNTLAYGYAAGNQTIYSINLSPLSASPLSTTGIPPATNFRGFGSSNEAPQNKYLYLANGNTVYKVDIATNAVVGQQTLTSVAGTPISPSLPSSGTLANLFAINQQQFIPLSGTTLPLVVRALDANGVPIAGASVTYSTTTSGVAFTNATVLTNSDGYASTSATVPSVQTSLTIVATVGVGNTQVFTINVGFSGGGGGGNGSGKLSILDGNGQVVYANTPLPKPMRVKVVDANGNPVPTAAVTWSLLTGGGFLTTTDTLTDADGIASNASYAAPLFYANSGLSPRPTISATTSLGSVTFSHLAIARFTNGTTTDTPAPGPAISQVVPVGKPEITGAVGSTIKGAFQFKVISQGSFSILQPLSGVGIEAQALPEEGSLDTVAEQTARCDGAPLSGDDGIATCDLVLGGKVTNVAHRSIVRVTVGAFQSFDFPLVVTPGAPKTITILSGNNQKGTSGQSLPDALLARVDDGFGSYLNGVPVTWAIQAGSATLFQTISTSGIGVIADPNKPGQSLSSPGLVSTNLRLGNSPGDVRVRVSISPTVFADFTVTNTLSLGNFTKIDGDNQSAAIGTAFAKALVIEAKDSNGTAVPNTPITFSGTGVSLSTTVVNTDSTGRAQVNVTAGNTIGTYTVTASTGASTATFTLNVTAAGPTITSVVNGASFQAGLSPCAIAQLLGTNFANGVTGTLSGQSIVGPLQTSLSGISVQIGGVSLPLFSVSNISGRQTVNFQVPCEQAPGPATLVLRSGSTSVNRDVTIAPYAPGIFSLDGSGSGPVVAVKANGTYVSAANPADRGEDIRVYVTGLGQASPFISTNTPGSGSQRVNGSVIVGVNNEGISARFEDTVYAPTLIGVYIVTFTMPSNTTPGTGRPFVVAVQAPDGSFSYSQPATIDIR